MGRSKGNDILFITHKMFIAILAFVGLAFLLQCSQSSDAPKSVAPDVIDELINKDTKKPLHFYEFSESSCTTGRHNFFEEESKQAAKLDYCSALIDETRNNQCAQNARYEEYMKNCQEFNEALNTVITEEGELFIINPKHAGTASVTLAQQVLVGHWIPSTALIPPVGSIGDNFDALKPYLAQIRDMLGASINCPFDFSGPRCMLSGKVISLKQQIEMAEDGHVYYHAIQLPVSSKSGLSLDSLPYLQTENPDSTESESNAETNEDNVQNAEESQEGPTTPGLTPVIFLIKIDMHYNNLDQLQPSKEINIYALPPSIKQSLQVGSLGQHVAQHPNILSATMQPLTPETAFAAMNQASDLYTKLNLMDWIHNYFKTAMGEEFALHAPETFVAELEPDIESFRFALDRLGADIDSAPSVIEAIAYQDLQARVLPRDQLNAKATNGLTSPSPLVQRASSLTLLDLLAQEYVMQQQEAGIDPLTLETPIISPALDELAYGLYLSIIESTELGMGNELAKRRAFELAMHYGYIPSEAVSEIVLNILLPSSDVRFDAFQAVKSLGYNTDQLPEINTLVGNQDQNVKLRGFELLNNLHSEAALESKIKFLHTIEDPQSRKYFLDQMMQSIEDPSQLTESQITAMQRGLEKGDETLKNAFYTLLKDSGQPAATTVLIQAMDEPSYVFRQKLFSLLEKAELNASHMGLIRSHRLSERYEVRLMAARLFHKIGGSDAVKELIRMTQDEYGLVRELARDLAIDLGLTADHIITAQIQVNAPIRGTRLIAIELLQSIPHVDATKALITNLGNPDIITDEAIFQALRGQTLTSDVYSLLKDVSEAASTRTYGHIVRLMAQIKNYSTAEKWVIEAAGHPEKSVSDIALDELSRMGGWGSTHVYSLEKLKDSNRLSVRKFMIKALKEVTVANATEALIDSLQEPDDTLRREILAEVIERDWTTGALISAAGKQLANHDFNVAQAIFEKLWSIDTAASIQNILKTLPSAHKDIKPIIVDKFSQSIDKIPSNFLKDAGELLKTDDVDMIDLGLNIIDAFPDNEDMSEGLADIMKTNYTQSLAMTDENIRSRIIEIAKRRELETYITGTSSSPKLPFGTIMRNSPYKDVLEFCLEMLLQESSEVTTNELILGLFTTVPEIKKLVVEALEDNRRPVGVVSINHLYYRATNDIDPEIAKVAVRLILAIPEEVKANEKLLDVLENRGDEEVRKYIFDALIVREMDPTLKEKIEDVLDEDALDQINYGLELFKNMAAAHPLEKTAILKILQNNKALQNDPVITDLYDAAIDSINSLGS